MSIVVDLIACLPSLYKTIQLPHTESWLFYALDAIAGLSILLVSAHSLTAILYPAYIMLINGAYVFIIWFYGYKVSGQNSDID
jgi:hypothetical protein